MEAEWNSPRSGKRTDVFAGGAGAETDVAILFVAVHLQLGGWNGSPMRVTALHRDEHRGIRQAVKKSNRSGGCEIGREKAEVKIRFPISRSGEGASQRGRIRAAPKETMMEQRHRRVKFRQDPLIFAPNNAVEICSELQIA